MNDIYRNKRLKMGLEGLKVTASGLVLSIVLTSTVTFNGDIKAYAEGISTDTQVFQNTSPSVYTVQAGDSLWLISQKTGVSVENLRSLNNLSGDNIYVGQQLKLVAAPTGGEQSLITKTIYDYYTVAPGDSLWSISQKLGVAIEVIKSLNNLTSDIVYVGQRLKVNEIKLQGTIYVVKAGDTLWGIAQNHKTTVDLIRRANNLQSDILSIGQELFVPISGPTAPPVPPPTQTPPVYNWPEVTYMVQPGDTLTSVAKKFGVSIDTIVKHNYMRAEDWLDAGDKIAISGYAPRTYTVTPNEASAPARVGKIVDWITEGQYLLRRGDIFTLVDVATGTQFKVKMMGGYNHSDVEPLTTSDTAIMKQLFGSWKWSPRAMVVYKDGMNIAASLSGMPHSYEIIYNNGVTGHFDVYLLNSSPHKENTAATYIEMHRNMVQKAGGY
ncbi:MAG: LysM peptidoglycan-binding domain-containing protein [Clostridia bacterium]|nr:LysM peptidoglycan-binding domain-containing protein [Clostridia bacterium]